MSAMSELRERLAWARRFAGPGLFLLGALTVLFIYWPGLVGGFFFDDHPNIVLNPGLRLEDLSVESLRLAWSSGISGQFGRPVSQLSFALNHYFSGFDPFVFKQTNLLIHCANGVLIYLLAWQLLDSLRHRVNLYHVELGAALIATAWMIHPIQLTSVLYVVQRMTSLSAFFLLAGALLHIKARRDWQLSWLPALCFLLAWAVFWPLSVLSKESGILFPGFVAAYELIVRRSEGGRLDVFGRAILALSVLVAAGALIYFVSPFGQWVFSGYKIRPFSLSERLMTEARVLWAYLGWIVFPSLESFALFHDDIVVSRSLLDPWTTLSAVLGLCALIIFVLVCSRRYPLPAFGIAWFLIGHALESTFIPLELVHEHRNYLSLLGIVLLPVALFDRLAARPGAQRTIVISVIGATLVYVGVLTGMRASMYGSNQIRTQVEAQLHPDSARTNYEAGRTLAAVADRDRDNMVAHILAGKHFEKATALDPDYKMGLLGSLVLQCGASQTVNQVALKELQRRLREGLVLPEDTSILTTFAELSSTGRSCLLRPEIEGLFSAFLENPGVDSDKRMVMYSRYADYLWLSGDDLPAAKAALLKALEIAPHHPSLRLKWAQLEFIAGNQVEAKRMLEELRGEPLSEREKGILDEYLNALRNREG